VHLPCSLKDTFLLRQYQSLSPATASVIHVFAEWSTGTFADSLYVISEIIALFIEQSFIYKVLLEHGHFYHSKKKEGLENIVDINACQR
jgi:hypothetical protein